MAKALDYYTGLQMRQQAADKPVTVCFGGIDNPDTAIPVGVCASDPIAAGRQVAAVRQRQQSRNSAHCDRQNWAEAALLSHSFQQEKLQAAGIDFNPDNWV